MFTHSVGVACVATLAFVNSVFLFSGEAALFSGLASAVLEQASGRFVPPGTRLADYPEVRGLLTGVAVFFLLCALVGWVAAFLKSLRFASAFFLFCLIDTVSCFGMITVLAFLAKDLRYALGHVPVLVMSCYVSMCANNFRLQIKGTVSAAGSKTARTEGRRSRVRFRDAPPTGAPQPASTHSSGGGQPAAGAPAVADDLDVTADDVELALTLPAAAARGATAASSGSKSKAAPSGSGVAEDEGWDTDEELTGDLPIRASAGRTPRLPASRGAK